MALKELALAEFAVMKKEQSLKEGCFFIWKAINEI